jgi:hypothetical protein
LAAAGSGEAETTGRGPVCKGTARAGRSCFAEPPEHREQMYLQSQKLF